MILISPTTSSCLSGSVLPIPTLPARGPEAKPTTCCVPSSFVSSKRSLTVAMPTSMLSTTRLPAVKILLIATLPPKVAVLATEIVLAIETLPRKVDIPVTNRLLIVAMPLILILEESTAPDTPTDPS